MKWRTKAIAAGAFLWGLAEATLFYVVPDVLITCAALDDRRKGLLACAFAVAGAVCGGALSYSFGALHPHTSRQLLDAVPAISANMIDRVAHELRVHGWAATLVGPFTGVPYKLFAAQAAAAGIPFALFLLITIPARAALRPAGAARAWPGRLAAATHRPARRTRNLAAGMDRQLRPVLVADAILRILRGRTHACSNHSSHAASPASSTCSPAPARCGAAANRPPAAASTTAITPVTATS